MTIKQCSSVTTESGDVCKQNFSGRAKKKMEDLERKMNLAKKNFVQWGGKLEEDRRRLKENRDSQR